MVALVQSKSNIETFWKELYKKPFLEEGIVAGIHLTEAMEASSTYKSTSTPFFSRIKRTLDYIPQHYWTAALAVFSNTFYFPSDMLDQCWKSLWLDFCLANSELLSTADIGKKCHFFEVDPSGLVNSFFHQNGISQRLHPDYYPRINNVQDIITKILNLQSNISEVREEAFRNLKKLSLKEYWFILTDKALSGQSLYKDIERYIMFRNLVHQWKNSSPKIVVLAQIYTHDADLYAKQNALFLRDENIQLFYSIYLNEEMKVNSNKCELYASPTVLEDVRELCGWLVEEILNKDSDFDTMRDKSGDDLRFGYRQCGLTIVDHDNCPANSLPLIWYDSTNSKYDLKPYKGIYPRVHSRLGKQKEHPTNKSWSLLSSENQIDEFLQVLRKMEAS